MAISTAEFLRRLKKTRKQWKLAGLNGDCIRSGKLCPIEIVFPSLPNAYGADDAGLLESKQMYSIINAADNGLTDGPNRKLRSQLLKAVGLTRKAVKRG